MAETYFKKAMRGYDTKQVDAFIVELSDRYNESTRDLESELERARKECERRDEELNAMRANAEKAESEHATELASLRSEYDALCASVGEKMVLADRRAADIVKNAEKEAECIIRKASAEGESRARAELERARQEAEKLISETEKRIAGISAAADEFRAKQNEMDRSMNETARSLNEAMRRLRSGIDKGE